MGGWKNDVKGSHILTRKTLLRLENKRRFGRGGGGSEQRGGIGGTTILSIKFE